MKIRNFLCNNKVFIIIVILVALTAFINGSLRYLGLNPFNDEFCLENPVQAAYTDNVNVYVSDSSFLIAVTDNGNKLLYTIAGNDGDSSFDHASAVTANAEGDIFVHDRSLVESGNAAYRERIIKFSNKGTSREVLYEVQTCNENEEQIIYLDGLQIINGELYFTSLEQDGVKVYRCNSIETVQVGFMPLENAYSIVADSSLCNDLRVSAVLMNGDVITYKNGAAYVLYEAREHDTDEYPSLITEIAYGSDGKLYINDMGHRIIYRVTEYNIESVCGRSAVGNTDGKSLGESPILSGLNASDGVISVLSTEYEYDADADKSIYYYCVLAFDYEGNIISSTDKLELSAGLKTKVIFLYICIAAFACLGIYSVIKIVLMIRGSGLSRKGTPVIILAVAIIITLDVSINVFALCNLRYAIESADNLTNLAYLIEATIDKDILENISSPDAYLEESYLELDRQLDSIMNNETNSGKNIYAILYKVKNNIICEVYRTDMNHGVMYPMAGVYESSIEQNITDENGLFVSYDASLSEGSYTFALIPVYNDNGEAIGLIETGTDYNVQTHENKELYKLLVLTYSMFVIIIMLLFSEIKNCIAAFREKKNSRGKRTEASAGIIRPVAFMMFFTANITTTFLPIYGMSLWNESFPLPSEVAAAFPLSAELVCSAVSALFCGAVIKRTGLKAAAVIGALFYIGGNTLSAFAGNLWALICANSLCGIGGGLLTVSTNTWVTGLDSEEKKSAGFVHLNAAFLAGINCGTVIGSMIYDDFGVKAAYYTAAGCAVLIIIFTLILINSGIKSAGETENKKKNRVSLRHFFTPRIIRYFVCLAIPYLICGSFLNYYFPIVAEKNNLTADEISMAFLISGVISIYAGTFLGDLVAEKMGIKRAMVLASFIYAAALFYLIINPSVSSCYVIIVLFAAADSFGLSSQSVYFAALPEVKKIGESYALGINNTIENITSACGSVIFGAALLMGEQAGIAAIAAAFSLLLTLYIMGGVKGEKSSEPVSK